MSEVIEARLEDLVMGGLSGQVFAGSKLFITVDKTEGCRHPARTASLCRAGSPVPRFNRRGES